jgi:hypothetical protein
MDIRKWKKSCKVRVAGHFIVNNCSFREETASLGLSSIHR